MFTVTGAAGFLGRAVVEGLVASGERVIAVDRRTYEPLPGERVLTSDLLDGNPRVTDALRTASAVVHLAGCPGVRDQAPDVAARRWRDNVMATGRVLQAVPPDVPVVVASSSSVYGGSMGGRPCAEDDALAPRGGYAMSKMGVEQLCAERIAAGARVTAARPFTVVGEGQRADMALSRWLVASAAGRPVPVYGSVDRRRDLTDVRQAAAALIALARLGEPGPVNIGTGRSHSLGEMLDAVAETLGIRPEVALCPAPSDDVAQTLADTGRLRSLIGWVPSIDLATVVRRQAVAAGLLSAHVAVPA